MMVTDVPSCVRTKPKKYFMSGPASGKMITLELREGRG
jgi:hypothetical protein